MNLIALIQDSDLFKEYSVHSMGYELRFKKQGVDNPNELQKEKQK